jgi:hypothetical protein
MTTCTMAPAGWYCTRESGHDGPCAAKPTGATKNYWLRKFEMMEGLQISRNVHYVDQAGNHCAAIIVKIWDKDSGMINVTAFNDWGGMMPSTTSVKYDATGQERHSWHWPERV